jgi:K+-sensing histidine kinase KdpD
MRAGKYESILLETDLQEILKKVIAEFTKRFPLRELSVDLEDQLSAQPLPLFADKAQLVKVLFGLLENAAQFSPPTQAIKLTLSEEENFWVIEIKDKGQGIPAPELKRIQSGFHKLAGDTHSGLGIGIYVAKTIIKLHRGRLKISSKLHKGTCIKIELPKAILI